MKLDVARVVERGDWVTMVCNATGDPEPAYSWTKDSITLTSSDHHVDLLDNGRKVVIRNVTTRDDGVYQCVAFNIQGNVSTTGNLTVHGK